MGEMDDRYVGFREHAAAVQRMDAELSRLREWQATTEASLLHQMTAVRSDVGELKQLLLRPPAPPVDHAALALQRAIDAVEKRGGSPSPFLTIFAIVGAIAMGVLATMLFIGG